MPASHLETLVLRCYACEAEVPVTSERGHDPVLDRAAWPDLACPVTPGCRGRLVPEALN